LAQSRDQEDLQGLLESLAASALERYELAEVRTIQVEVWLPTLPLAKSSCLKIRNLMSVLFNNACRYELFDGNPIYLVRQSAKRRKVPIVLMPAEIKALVNCLGVRERTLVLLAASTGLRQSTFCTTGRRSRIAATRAQKGREMRPFRALDGFKGTYLTLLECMAGRRDSNPRPLP
jgi:site-specific recombinase XerD